MQRWSRDQSSDIFNDHAHDQHEFLISIDLYLGANVHFKAKFNINCQFCHVTRHVTFFNDHIRLQHKKFHQPTEFQPILTRFSRSASICRH